MPKCLAEPKEGSFSEQQGKPALRLVGDVHSVGSPQTVVITKGAELSAKEQFVEAVVVIEQSVDGKLIPNGRAQMKALFDELHPRVRARIAFALAVTSGAKDENVALSIQVLPVFRNVSVESITVQAGRIGELLGLPQVDLTATADGLVRSINGAADLISAGLTRLDRTSCPQGRL